MPRVSDLRNLLPTRRESRLAAFLLVMALSLVASEATGWPRLGPWLDGRMVFGLWLPLLAGGLLTEREHRLGLGFGDRRRGLAVLGVGVPLAGISAVVLGFDAEIDRYYRPSGSPAPELVLRFLPAVLQVEVCFRGVLLFGLLPRLGPWPAAAVAAIPYGLVHLDKPLVEALGSVPVGFALGLAALWAGSLWYGFAVHLLGSVLLVRLG